MNKNAPKFGMVYRINLPDPVRAIHDTHIQGKAIKLVDWAKNLENDARYTPRQKEALKEFFKNRKFPNAEELEAHMLERAVYGIIQETHSQSDADKPYMRTVILCQDELAEV